MSAGFSAPDAARQGDQVQGRLGQLGRAVAGHINLQFEDGRTIRYQSQERLRIQMNFKEVEGIQSGIEAYAPLVPDSLNWKATLMIRYPDPPKRKCGPARLIGVEDRLFVEAEGHARVCAIADEDLDRERRRKTLAVHFVRFEFSPLAREAVRAGAAVKLGCHHAHCPPPVQTVPETLASLASEQR